ncbi:hypothetical protein AB0I22_30935 [Streptomyces sp. NPDC050610]|uniref:hypothetical protein n=1 Tax=Streptomyces sp. NPDC050610 TaxID=3157097 RepID=UPI00343687D5
MVIIAEGRRVAVRTDEPSATYTHTDISRCERPTTAEPGRAVRAVVELSRALGGMHMRALLGAEFTPGPVGAVTVFEVPFGGPLGLGADAECESELGRPLAAGLPRDFASAALDGLAGDVGGQVLPAGLLRVDRAGFDEVGSSEMAFRLAGGLLRAVIHASLHHADPLAAARAAASGW